jgi:hypothetical protein
MAEQDRDDKEDEGDESSGMLHLIWNFEHYSGSVGQLFACKYILAFYKHCK